jgi:hypothetical protein
MERTTTTIAATALALLLTACAGSPMRIAMSDPATLQAESTDKLCAAYGQNLGRDKVRAELQRRDALTAREWEHVDKRKVFIGMSSTAALCSWGSPDRINSTITGGGRSEQWVYTCPTSTYRGCNYLYTVDGRVSAIQQ